MKSQLLAHQNPPGPLSPYRSERERLDARGFSGSFSCQHNTQHTRSPSRRRTLRTSLLVSLALLPALVTANSHRATTDLSSQYTYGDHDEAQRESSYSLEADDENDGQNTISSNLRLHLPAPRSLSQTASSFQDDLFSASSESESSEDVSISNRSWWESLSSFFRSDYSYGESEYDNAYSHSQYERDLSSRSSDNSRDRNNFWKLYYDDQYWKDRDDDFYKYIGDPKPPSLLPLQRRHVVGFMLASIGVVLGSAGGIGGGGLVIPVLIIIMGFAPRIAIPLGSVTVFGGSFAGLLLNLKRRHPLADRPIIDWDLILVMEPVVLVGTLFGSILHRVFSEKLLTILLVLLLSIVAHMTLSKAKRMSAAEHRYLEQLKASRLGQMSRIYSFRSEFRASTVSADAVNGTLEDDDIKMEIPVGNPPPVSPHSVGPVPIARTQSIESQTISPNKLNYDERQRILILNPDFVTLRSDLIEQEKATPRSKIIALLGKFTVLMFLNITLGGGSFRSPWGIQCGSVAFWVVHVIMVAFLLSSAWAAQVCTYLYTNCSIVSFYIILATARAHTFHPHVDLSSYRSTDLSREPARNQRNCSL